MKAPAKILFLAIVLATLTVVAVSLIMVFLTQYTATETSVKGQYTATVNVFTYTTDVGLYLDSTCKSPASSLNFEALSNKVANRTVVTYLCVTVATNLDVNITIAKVESPVTFDVDNGPEALVRLFISNWDSVLKKSSQNMKVIQTDFTITIDSARAVAGAYGWSITITTSKA